MTGAEAIYVPMIIGAAAGAGSAAARGGGAGDIALGGLAGGATGGIGGWAAAPAATAGSVGAGAGFSGVGPLTSLTQAAPATLGTGTAAGTLGSQLGSATAGPLLSEYAAGLGAGQAAGLSGWSPVVKQSIGEFTKPILAQALQGKPRRAIGPPPQPERVAVAPLKATPIRVASIAPASGATISADILRNYIASLRR